jgi:threonine/homoserine/homoserine lactone efflux protein
MRNMTSSTFTSLLLLALTAALSPFSLIAFSLVLATGRGPKNGIAFICGWVTTITLIGVVEALIGANVEVKESNTAGKWTLALELALGIVLIAIWARRRFRPRPEDDVEVVVEAKPEPAWQRRIGTMGYAGAFVTGGAVQTWPVMIAAGAAILRLDIGPAAGLAWMFAFALLTTAGIVVLEVLAWRNPSSAVERLDRLRGYIQTHRDSVINWASLVGGLWLTIRGAMGLA